MRLENGNTLGCTIRCFQQPHYKRNSKFNHDNWLWICPLVQLCQSHVQQWCNFNVLRGCPMTHRTWRTLKTILGSFSSLKFLEDLILTYLHTWICILILLSSCLSDPFGWSQTPPQLSTSGLPHSTSVQLWPCNFVIRHQCLIVIIVCLICIQNYQDYACQLGRWACN